MEEVAEPGFETEAELSVYVIDHAQSGIPGIIHAPDVGKVSDLFPAFRGLHGYIVADQEIGRIPIDSIFWVCHNCFKIRFFSVRLTKIPRSPLLWLC